MAKPFRYRDGWRIQVTLKNGERPPKDFLSYAEAVQWGNDQLANANSEHAPKLGGPRTATLAQLLDHYARQKSINKGGATNEIARINHYLEGASMPLLALGQDEQGKKIAIEKPPTRMGASWLKHHAKRRALRSGTYQRFAELAVKRCSTISIGDIDALKDLMESEGLEPSTIQKEIAMLKVVFNTAIKKWGWKGLENPCDGIKLGSSNRRFVYVTDEQRNAVQQALSECDNPYMHALCMVAKESTLRQKTLLDMKWADVDLLNRSSVLDTKTGQAKHILSLDVQQALAGLPRHESGKIFPVTANAVKSCWNRVRIKAGVPELQFKDLRHLGATDWVRRGLTAHELMLVLGHKSIVTAQFYVDLVNRDLKAALDRASQNGESWTRPATVTVADAATVISERRAVRMLRVTAQRVQATKAASHHDAVEENVPPNTRAAPAGTAVTLAMSPSREMVKQPAATREVTDSPHPASDHAGTPFEALRQAVESFAATMASPEIAPRSSNVVPFRPRKTA
jgi:integrase